MKLLLCVCFAVLLSAPFLRADQVIGYPKSGPLIDVSFPDGWEVQIKDGLLLATPKDDESFIVSLTPMEAGADDTPAAIKEAKEAVEDSFQKVTYDELQKIEGEGVASLLLQAKGEDEDGKANIASLLINQPKAEHLFLLQLISSGEGFEKHGEAGLKLIRSVKAHGQAAAVQTFSYPNKEKPVFAVDFPGDWTFESDSESAYVVSPDKLVAFNVLLIGQDQLPVAVGKLKADVGGKFESIKWDDASKVSKDDALGVTAKFHHGIAVSGENKVSVNIAEYVRKEGDKFLVIICQHPLEALKVHGEAIEEIIQSVKVK